MPQAMTITNLTKRFGDTTAVDGVDLEVAVARVLWPQAAAMAGLGVGIFTLGLWRFQQQFT